MGDPSTETRDEAQRLTEGLLGFGAYIDQCVTRTKERMAAAERGAWPITVWSKPVETFPVNPFPFGCKPRPEAETEDAANPASVTDVTLDDIKAHLADTFTAEDLDVAGDFVTTFAFPAKRNIYLAIEDEAGKTRVFQVAVQEIV